MASHTSARQLVTGLFDSIPRSTESSTSGNPLSGLPTTSKDTFLTLHVLFPNELLPALDLLDRGLVTRLRLAEHHTAQDKPDNAPTEAIDNPSTRHDNEESLHQGSTEQHIGETSEQPPSTVNALKPTATHKEPNSQSKIYSYYVRSAQQPSSRNSGSSRFRNAAYEHAAYYEVRLHAWSCSCPAFAFSAFPAIAAPVTAPKEAAQDTSAFERLDHPMGGDGRKWCFGGLSKGDDMPVCKHLIACVLVEHTGLFGSFVEEKTVSAEEMAGWAAGWGD